MSNYNNEDKDKDHVLLQCPKHFILVGLIGKKGSGKDTLAAKLAEKFTGVQVLRFADFMKCLIIEQFEMINAINPKIAEEAYSIYLLEGVQAASEHLKKHTSWWRPMLQCIGTEVVRALDDEIFIDYMIDKVAETARKGFEAWAKKEKGKPILIITDIRFDNEAEMVSKFMGFNYRIDTGDRLQDEDEHESEQLNISEKWITAHIDNSDCVDKAFYEFVRELNKIDID